jgi:hypothetical protein
MTALDVVHEWVEAVTAASVPRVMARSAGDIVLGGPRGTIRGQPALRDWVENGGLQMFTERRFAAGTRVVLAQRAVWRDRRGLPIADARIAHRFAVDEGRVSVAVRYDSLAKALADSQLTEADEIDAGPEAGGTSH